MAKKSLFSIGIAVLSFCCQEAHSSGAGVLSEILQRTALRSGLKTSLLAHKPRLKAATSWAMQAARPKLPRNTLASLRRQFHSAASVYAPYKIHPAIGVARVGNSATGFYVAPTEIGGLPTEFATGKPVRRFKDDGGFIKRQAAQFGIYDVATGKPVTLSDSNVESITWKVHIANKKAAWRQFAELDGDILLGSNNSYDDKGTPWRNATVTGRAARQKLIIDPGSRKVTKPGERQVFDSSGSYKYTSFPSPALQPYSIQSLGEMYMDKKGQLLVLGGFGNSGGTTPISSYAGADSWHDDVADGPVEAEVKFKGGKDPITLNAWVVTGSPKYVPELVNISTWDDVIFDMAVRNKPGFAPAFFDITTKKYKLGKDGYNPCFHYDIKSVFQRMKGYQWVANVAPMVGFATPDFDISDNSETNKANRKAWFNLLHKAVDLTAPVGNNLELGASHEQLFEGNSEGKESAEARRDRFPLMPLNSGDNSVTNSDISKFMAFTPTQYYMLYQWSEGNFNKDQTRKGFPTIFPLDRTSVGNCVGYPMSPGIEVTWSVRNPILYNDTDPYRLKHAHAIKAYDSTGLSPERDETIEAGCEPGDLTKRMATPWQADFFQCSVQNINFTDTEVNQVNMQPTTPTYYAYWWPVQSPWNVYTSNFNRYQQVLDGGNPSGIQVMYQRGINSFAQTITSWKYLGFVLNANTDASTRDRYQNFVERERNFDKFRSGVVAVSDDGVVTTTQIAKTVTAAKADAASFSVPIYFQG